MKNIKIKRREVDRNKGAVSKSFINHPIALGLYSPSSKIPHNLAPLGTGNSEYTASGRKK